MDNNYNYSNAYSDSYFTLTPFDSNITNPASHNLNQLSMPDWFYPNQFPNLGIMNKIGIIIINLHQVNGDTTPPSHIVKLQSNIQLQIFLVMINP